MPGADLIGIDKEKSSCLTIVSKSSEHAITKSRIIHVELTSVDDRNTVLTGLR